MDNANLNKYLIPYLHKEGIKKQFIFSKAELKKNGTKDPLKEKSFSKAKGLIHRYPDRVVLTVTNKCFAYCRFCFRKNNWHNFEGFDLRKSVDYIKTHPKIREVIISGGDPFFLSDETLKFILSELKESKHLSFIRIGTRVLSTNPERITTSTISMLKIFSPIWVIIHVNHPDEITRDFKKASKLLIDNGIPVVSQTVLLKGINDNTKVLEMLFCTLVKNNIKPYYLFGCDQAEGNEHFRVSIDKSLKILDKLRGNISGLCIPTFAFDLPEGGGKIVIEPNKIVQKSFNRYVFRNFEKKEVIYDDV